MYSLLFMRLYFLDSPPFHIEGDDIFCLIFESGVLSRSLRATPQSDEVTGGTLRRGNKKALPLSA